VTLRTLLAGLVLGLLVISCSTGEGDPTVADAPTDEPQATEEVADTDTVEVELGEWSVFPDPDAVHADEITFEVSNGGQDPHEFVIVKSDLEPGELPTADDGSVDEEQVDVIDEVEEIEAGGDGEVEVDLEAGSYVLFCNLVEEEDGETEVHYKLGMRTAFTVS
jgi:uncharacterized cupredoxin-like copper-binding protein